MAEPTKEIIIAPCGLICSDCGMFKRERCAGCPDGEPIFKNCAVRKCVTERAFITCADCGDFANLKDCKRLNNFISQFCSFIFRTDRIGNLNRIREAGMGVFKEGIAEAGKE